MNTIIIKTTPAFEKKSSKLLTNNALEELYDYLEANPEQGQLIRGTGRSQKITLEHG